MAKGRHARGRSKLAIILAAAAGVLILAAAGVAFAGYRYDQARAERIMPGVTVAGVDVGGMTAPEAVKLVRAEASTRLDATITVSAAGSTWTVTPRDLGQHADAADAVERALAVTDRLSPFERIWHRVRDEPVDASFDLTYAGDRKVDGFVVDVSRAVKVKPVNAQIGYDDGELFTQRSSAGRTLDASAAAGALTSALGTGDSSVTLPVLKVRPKVTNGSLGRTIVVRVDRNLLELYDGFEVIRTWTVATAMPGWTTPNGDWVIYRKAVNPTWYNPALDSWGADLPAVVPGGPYGVMGTRALYITAPGLIRIHGTTADSSIGTYASHGCIRMHNWEIEQLYPLIPEGTHVIVVGHRPENASVGSTPASLNI